MKWVLVVVVCLIVELPVRRSVHAKSITEEKSSAEEVGLPALNLKFPEDEANKLVDSSSDNAVTTSEADIENAGSETAEVSTDLAPQVVGLNALEEESGDNELKRVKKSNSLTTICVEIKPTSPYEPPYFMCRGTEPKYQPTYHSDGGYKPSNAYKPSSHKGDGYGGGGGYGYAKPSYSAGYGSQEEYSGPEHKVKPGAGSYGYGGGYGKPSSTAGEGYSSGGSHGGGYESSGVHGSYGPSHSSYSHDSYGPSHSSYSQGGGGGGGGEYSKPAKYQQGHDSYGPPSHVKPIKYVAPYEKPHTNTYKPASPTYGAPTAMKYTGHYGYPSYQGPSGSPYGGTAGHSGAAYGPDSYNHGSSGGADGAYRTKVFHHGKQQYGKNIGYKKHHGGGNNNYNKGIGYSSGGYRSVEEIDDEEEEFDGPDDMPIAPQLQSPYNPAMPPSYGQPGPYMPPPGPVYSMPAPKAYTYPSPAPQVPCGSNLLFGCQPNVVPVPCYKAPQASPTPVVYSVPAAQPPPIAYGPPVYQQPIGYYPTLGAPHQTPSTNGVPANQPGDESSKKTSDSKKTQSRTQDDQSENGGEDNRSAGNIEMNQQNGLNEDKPKVPSPPTEPYPLKPESDQARNAAEEKTSSTGLDISRQNGGSSQDAEMMKKNDGDDPSKKVDPMMRMQQMQHMAQMMNGNVEGMQQMRRDVMHGGMGGYNGW